MSIITIPIETKVREFIGKLWLAINLAKNGHKVALGDKTSVRSLLQTELKPDLHIDKTLAYSDKYYNFLNELKDSNCKIGILDTEGMPVSKDDYFSKRVSDKVLEIVDTVFCWGDFHAQVIKNRTSFPSENINVTGNPRFDVLKPKLKGIYKKEADQIRKDFGPYILVTTNFAKANPFDNDKFETIWNERNIEIGDSKKEFQSKLLRKFIDLIDKLSEQFPKHNVIIRPHPSEDHERYRKEFSSSQDVLVEHFGDVRSWIFGSDAVIQNGSTTGIESVLMQTPTISYEPEINKPDDTVMRSPLPNKVSVSANSVEDVLDKIKSFISRSKTPKLSDSQKNALKNRISNIDTSASKKMTSIINSILSEDNTPNYSDPSTLKQIKLFIKNQPIAPYIQQVRGLFKNVDRDKYRSQKFPGLSIEEVRMKLDDFEDQVGNLDLTVKRVNYLDDVYWIQKK